MQPGITRHGHDARFISATVVMGFWGGVSKSLSFRPIHVSSVTPFALVDVSSILVRFQSLLLFSFQNFDRELTPTGVNFDSKPKKGGRKELGSLQ